MLPGASVCGLVFSLPEAQFLLRAEQIVVRQCHSLGEKLTSGALGLIAEVFHSCDVELIVVRQCPDHGKSRSSSTLVMWS